MIAARQGLDTRIMTMIPLHISFVIALLLPIIITAPTTRFDQFFPSYRWYFTNIRDHQCAALYAAQQQFEEENVFEGDLCGAVLDCMLEHTTESVKANMASSSVGLGLMPTILTFLGSSTSETALLSRRRPLLSFLIACGSPAVRPLPTFIYQDPVAGLKAREGRLLPRLFPRLSTFQAAIIVLAEYILILAAMANVFTASYYMGIWTINTFACPNTFNPILWVGLTVLIHLLGMFALALRTETMRDSESRPSIWARISERVRYEIKPCLIHDKLILEPKNESTLFIFISWCTSVGTVGHLLYGTVVFSSMTFVDKLLGSIISSRYTRKLTDLPRMEGCHKADCKIHGIGPRMSSGFNLRIGGDEECFILRTRVFTRSR